ncbi:hypothetical protein pb186bvf_008685 [Paramecium bursaria]
MIKLVLGGLGLYGLKVSSQEVELNQPRNAICILYPDNGSKVNGIVSFQQDRINAPTKIVAVVRNLNPNSLHGIHIHKYGDLTNGCATAGPHYNPFNQQHGGLIDKVRHVGDLGNLKTDERGAGYLAIEDQLIQLHGEFSVIGRSVVIHAGQDDLGRGGHPDSLTTGNSGARVACGVIGYAEQFKNLQPYV